jgi:outer membrane lipoprotein-sorting protein
MMKRILACLLLLNLNFAWGIFDDTRFMPKTIKLEFEQSYQSVTGKTKSSKGILDYKKPGHLRLKEFKDNTEFVANKDMSWYYVPPFKSGEKGSVQINSAKNNALIKVLDSLKYGLNKNEFYEVTEKKVDQFELKFIDQKSKELKISKVDLFFRTVVFPEKTDHKQRNSKILEFHDLQSLSIHYQDGQKVDLKITKIEENITFADKNFEFQTPPNTEIIKN